MSEGADVVAGGKAPLWLLIAFFATSTGLQLPGLGTDDGAPVLSLVKEVQDVVSLVKEELSERKERDAKLVASIDALAAKYADAQGAQGKALLELSYQIRQMREDSKRRGGL